MAKVTTQDALEVTGSLSYEMMDRLMQFCEDQSSTRCIRDIAPAAVFGQRSTAVVGEALLVYCRDLLLYQQAPQLLEEKSLQITPGFKTLAQAATADQIYHWITVLNETQNEVRFTNNPTIYLGVAVVKLANQRRLPASGEVSVSNQEVQQLRQKFRSCSQKYENYKKTHRRPAVNRSIHLPRRPKIAALSEVPKRTGLSSLERSHKKISQMCGTFGDDLLMSLSVTQRAMLHASEAKAASASGVVIAFDYERLSVNEQPMTKTCS